MDKQTTGMSLAQQRKEIHALLNKLSHPDKAGESYELALHYGIHEPWISLCAYNLAHALLAKGADQGSLLEAERLFKRSMEADFLGPWPALFRLAALERRNSEQTESIKNAFIEAKDALIEYRRCIHSETSTPDLDPRPDFQKMLQVAGAFLGPDLSSMPGKPMGYAQEPKGWVLVGYDPKLSALSLPRDFVLQEIEALSEKEKDAVFFKLSSKPLRADAAPLLRHWRMGREAWQVVANYPALRLLAMILSKKRNTMEGLVRKLCGGDSPTQRNTFSQNKRRLRKDLMQITKGQAENLFVSGRGEFPEINPAIQIYGAVEKSVL